MNKLSYLLISLLLISCSKDNNQVEDDSKTGVYLHENNKIIIAYPETETNTTWILGGIEYYVVSESKLRELLSNGEFVSLSNICTTKVQNMKNLFVNSNIDWSLEIQSISSWDVSNVKDMSGMFKGQSDFNQNLNSWDVSNVTNMSEMFSYCRSFNSQLNNWNVGKVTNMENMFKQCSLFNQNLNTWDVSNVKNMMGMFSTYCGFNENLGNWDVSNVTNMGFMFNDNHKFNKNIGDWDVSNVTDMRLMFFCDIIRDGLANKSTFNQDISNWNVSSVKHCNSFSDYGSLEGKHKPNFSNCN